MKYYIRSISIILLFLCMSCNRQNITTAVPIENTKWFKIDEYVCVLVYSGYNIDDLNLGSISFYKEGKYGVLYPTESQGYSIQLDEYSGIPEVISNIDMSDPNKDELKLVENALMIYKEYSRAQKL